MDSFTVRFAEMQNAPPHKDEERPQCHGDLHVKKQNHTYIAIRNLQQDHKCCTCQLHFQRATLPQVNTQQHCIIQATPHMTGGQDDDNRNSIVCHNEAKRTMTVAVMTTPGYMCRLCQYAFNPHTA